MEKAKFRRKWPDLSCESVKLADFFSYLGMNQVGAETSSLHTSRKAGPSFRLAKFGEAALSLR
jgi:hypothetical protein